MPFALRRVGAAHPALPGARARLVAALLALLLLAGCRADLSVEVRTARGGGGELQATVRLDREAAGRVPDLADQLRLDDLRSAGWRVDGPRPAADGGTVLQVSKPFSSAAGAARAVEELSGSGGPFGTLVVTTERTFWKTRTAVGGGVDLTGGLEAFSDQALAGRLGSPLGVSPAELEREVGRPLAEAFAFEVVARLPGRVASNAPLRRGGAVVWPARLGETVAVTASSEAWNTRRIALAGVALGSALALLVVLVRRSRLISWG